MTTEMIGMKNISMKEIQSIEPANVRLDLPVRVDVVEEEFFRTAGHQEYQLWLCERLHTKCVDAVLRAAKHGGTSVDEAIKLVKRMDAVLLKGMKKTKQSGE